MGALYGIGGAWNPHGTKVSVPIYTGRLNQDKIPNYQRLPQHTQKMHRMVSNTPTRVLENTYKPVYEPDGLHAAAVKALNLDVWA